MKLEKLINSLQKIKEEFGGNIEVLSSKDDEGNGYRRLGGGSCVVYVHKDHAKDYEIETVYYTQKEFKEDLEEPIKNSIKFVLI